MDNRFYQIALTKIPTVGPKIAKTLVSYCKGVQPIFESNKKSLLTIPGIGQKTADAILDKKYFDEVALELEYIDKNKIDVLFYLEDQYPSRLKNIEDSPVVLYKKGDFDVSATKMVSIIGTRNPTPYGVHQTNKLVEVLADQKITVVSGMAYGVDITAHKACLQYGTPTIGILGHGLDTMYPSDHRKVALEMTKDGGLLTEFPIKSRADREHFPMRNRIIAAISDATIVVETKEKGGSMITAQMAFDYHKDVMAIPGRITDEYSKGCNFLIKNNMAHLIEKPEDILTIMSWQKSQMSAPKGQTFLFADFNEMERKLIDAIIANPEADIDQLLFILQMKQSELAPVLLELELKNIIQTLPGKKFMILS